MNLSLTPLNEAYNTLASSKLKQKTKPNIYTNIDYQKQMLKESNMETQIKLPQGYNNTLTSASFDTKQSDEDSLILKITDPELKELLKPYKEDYILDMLKNKMQDTVEFFQNPKQQQTCKSEANDIDIQMLIGILILLLIIDIAIRIKFRI